MNKELEGALTIIKIKCHPNSNPSPLVDGALEIVEQALTELKAIKEANPSEAFKGRITYGNNSDLKLYWDKSERYNCNCIVDLKVSNSSYIRNVLKREVVSPVCEDGYYVGGGYALKDLPLIYDRLQQYEDLGDLESIKQSLLKAQEQEEDIIHYKGTIENLRRDNAILKDLKNEQEKVLEIIKKKCLYNDNLCYAAVCINYDKYKEKMSKKHDTAVVKINWNSKSLLDCLKLLTQEEFDLLKRWQNGKRI